MDAPHPHHPDPRRAAMRRVRRAAAVALTATVLLAACSRDADQVAVQGPPATDAAGDGALTVGTEPPGTAPAETTTTLDQAGIDAFLQAWQAADQATTTTAPPPPPPTTAPAPSPGPRGRVIAPDAPPVNPGRNVYGNIGPGNVNPATEGALTRVYVPHEVSGYTTVIDPVSLQIIGTFPTGAESQHVVPSWDMTTLYAVSGRDNRITPIDPKTGEPGTPIPVEDPYNLYWTPDGSLAIVVVEGRQRLDFRDARTFELVQSVPTPCYGINHIDFDADLTYFLATCEFEGAVIKVDLASRSVVGKIKIDMTPSGRIPRRGYSMPQDVRLSSDGSVFFVADLQSDGLYLIDGARLKQVGFIPAGVGTHSLYPSRDGRRMYVVNRGTGIIGGPPGGKGSLSVLDPYTREIVDDWPIPGGGSPDMGNLTMDGTQLWLGGRYDGEVYVFDLVNGGLAARIRTGVNPHGLTVWPQPGRFSLGHTGNLR